MRDRTTNKAYIEVLTPLLSEFVAISVLPASSHLSLPWGSLSMCFLAAASCSLCSQHAPIRWHQCHPRPKATICTILFMTLKPPISAFAPPVSAFAPPISAFAPPISTLISTLAPPIHSPHPTHLWPSHHLSLPSHHLQSLSM